MEKKSDEAGLTGSGTKQAELRLRDRAMLEVFTPER